MKLTFEKYPGVAHSDTVAFFLHAWTEANPEQIQAIDRQLGLTLNDNNSSTNLCYVNSNELKDEYKMGYTQDDLFYFFYGFMHSFPNRDNINFGSNDQGAIPVPNNVYLFWKIVTLGRTLNKIHVIKDLSTGNHNICYRSCGSDLVKKIRFIRNTFNFGKGVLFINETAYFSKVSSWAWNFNISGHNPLYHWLTTRMGFILTEEDRNNFMNLVDMIEQSEKPVNEIRRILKISK